MESWAEQVWDELQAERKLIGRIQGILSTAEGAAADGRGDIVCEKFEIIREMLAKRKEERNGLHP